MKWRLILVLAVLAILAPAAASAVTLQEALLLAKPAVALVTAEVRAEVTLNCGRGTVTVRPTPFVETGTGWFIDGRGYLITNGHVVDPAHRMPAWVTHELKKKAIDQACVHPLRRAHRRRGAHHRLPGRRALARAAQQVGDARRLGDERRRLGLQARRHRTGLHPDRRCSRARQLRRTRRRRRRDARRSVDGHDAIR